MPSKPTTERLQFAVAAGNYPEVERLLTQYRGEVESRWHSSSKEQRQVIAAEATNLLVWVRHTILAARSHAQLKHGQFVRQSAYSRARTVAVMPRSGVELDA